MNYLFLLIPAALGLFVVWCVKSPSPLAGQVVYQRQDTGKLFLYTRRWNVCGHRSARQDWWQEIELTGRGTYRRIGCEFKHNVGYDAAADAVDWCHPYEPLSSAQLLQRQREAQVRTGSGAACSTS